MKRVRWQCEGCKAAYWDEGLIWKCLGGCGKEICDTCGWAWMHCKECYEKLGEKRCEEVYEKEH